MLYRATSVGAASLMLWSCGDEPLPTLGAGGMSLNPASAVLTVQDGPDAGAAQSTITIVGIAESGRPAENTHFDVLTGGGCFLIGGEDLGILELEGRDGCQTRSASFLQCTLSTAGTAQFNVKAKGASPTEGPQVVTVRAAGNGNACQELTVNVVSELPLGSHLSVRQIRESIAAEADPFGPNQYLTCGSQARPLCRDRMRAIPFDVAVVAEGDVPFGLPFESRMTLSVNTQAGDTDGVGFSVDDCETTKQVLDLSLAVGAAVSRRLSFCTNGSAATHTIHAIAEAKDYRLRDTGNLEGSAQVVVLPQPARLQWSVQATTVDAGTQHVVNVSAQDCEGKPLAIDELNLETVSVTAGAAVPELTLPPILVDGRLQFTATTSAPDIQLIRATLPSTASQCLIALVPEVP
jgi:hypothetical protein